MFILQLRAEIFAFQIIEVELSMSYLVLMVFHLYRLEKQNH